MARTFKLPDLGEGIHEGEIIEVLVSVGDQVKEGDDILVVETDKAAVDIPSPYTGEVTGVEVEPGDLIHVGDTIMTFSGGEEEPKAEEAEEPEEAPEEGVEEEGPPETEGEAPPERKGPVPASPSTRRLARELGVDLGQVPPSGPAGRVTSEDVRAFAERAEEGEEAPAEEEEKAEARVLEWAPEEIPAVIPSGRVPSLPDFTRWGDVERVPLRSVRRSTAKQMALSWSQIPHVNHQDKADITELEHFRERHKGEVEERGGSLTPTVFAMKAAVAALREHPRFNASLDPEKEEIILKQYYHIGIAVDTDRGLLVPVIRDVDQKSITELSIELREMVQRTRSGETTLDELQGGTLTITNIGILGGTAFFPIINFPEVAILGMARAHWEPMVRRNEEGEFETEPRYVLPLMLSFDHRVVDGADAARFVGTVKDALESPENLLLTM